MKQIGRYEIQRELGRGAMGVVYAAMDPLIGRQVAIKTIRLGALDAEANHAELTQRLHREARAAGVLSHPGILTIFDVGEQGEDAYIVMEFIDGRTLEEMLASGVPQRSNMLISVLRKAAEALDYAHAKGIIHRDIKPSNIMICTDGSVKIADFGVAKLTASTSMTQSGFVLGTPSYMSPEQAQGRAIDGRSDQFSLAVVAYRMLTGKLPFEGPTLTALLAKILWEDPEYESAGLNPPIRPVFEKALTKDPLMRFSDCAEFVRELEAAYARSKAEALNAAPFMTGQITASADSKAVSPGFYSEAKTTLSLETADSTRQGAAETASLITPAPETFVSREGKKNSQSSSSVVPEIAAQAPKRRSVLIAWMAGLGALVLAMVAFFAIRAIQKPAPLVQEAPTNTVATIKTDAVKIAPPSEPIIQPKKQEEAATPRPTSAKTELSKAAVPAISIPKPKPLVTSTIRVPSESGFLAWSGNLEKNSILVITDQKATIGSIVGQFPGKPISVDVEPKDLVIRQKPGEINQWNQIILYSGNNRFSSITIRWKLIK